MPDGPEKFQPIGSNFSSDENRASAAAKSRRRKWCGCIAVLTITAVAVTLVLTIFTLKHPIVRVGKFNFDSIEVINGTNAILNVDVSVKNPNFATLRYGNITTSLFYRGEVVGDLWAPPGSVGPRRSARVNVTVDILEDRILARPGLFEDLDSGLVNVSSYTRVWGKMGWFVFEKRVWMKMNCSISFNITSRAIQQRKCKRKIKL